MASFEFNDYSSLGVGAESFFLLEDESPAAEVEVKLNDTSVEDQQEDAAADSAAAAADETSDAGAELFKDVSRIANIEKVLSRHDLHPSLYAFLNADGQLNNLINTQLPGVESLSMTSSNSETINSILPGLESLFRNSINPSIPKFFDTLARKMKVMQHATDTVVATRMRRVARLIARLEQDAAPEEVTVAVGGDTADEPASTEPVNVDANTAEECGRLMNTTNISGLKDSVLVRDMDDAINGNDNALRSITDYVRKNMRALSNCRQVSHTGRRITYNKHELIAALRMYKRELSNWANINMMHFACQKLANYSKGISVVGSESFSKILPKYKVMTVIHNYLQVSKKIMDTVYYNLSFASRKLLTNR